MLALREQLYVHPLYAREWLRSSPRLYCALVLGVDATLVLLALSVLYLLALAGGWGVISGYRWPASTQDRVVIFLLSPFVPGLIPLSLAACLVFILVAALAGLSVLIASVCSGQYGNPVTTVTAVVSNHRFIQYDSPQRKQCFIGELHAAVRGD